MEEKVRLRCVRLEGGAPSVTTGGPAVSHPAFLDELSATRVLGSHGPAGVTRKKRREQLRTNPEPRGCQDESVSACLRERNGDVSGALENRPVQRHQRHTQHPREHNELGSVRAQPAFQGGGDHQWSRRSDLQARCGRHRSLPAPDLK